MEGAGALAPRAQFIPQREINLPAWSETSLSTGGTAMSRPADALVHRIDRRVFFGWPMVAAGALIFFASGPGQSHTFGVFLTYLAHDLGLSHTEISFAYGAATLAAAFGLPFAGRRIDRRGARPVLTVIALLLGTAAIAFGFVNGLVVLALGFAAVRYLGQGCLMLGASNLVSQWFERRRGFALSLTSLGFSASVALHPPFAQWLIETVGWREAWTWLGISTWVLLLPVLWFVRSRPEDVGLRPDGEPPPDRPPNSAPASSPTAPPGVTGLTLKQAVRTSAFWIVAFGLSLLALLATGLFFHQVAIFEHRGLDAQMATRVFAITAIVAVVSAPVLGRIMDRAPSHLVFAGAQLLMAAALAALYLVEDAATAVAYAIVFGVANASIHVNVSYLWADYFGRRHLGSIQGTGQTILIVGASLGPLPFSLSIDLAGDYAAALTGSIALSILVTIVAGGFLRPPRYTPLQEEPSG